MKVFHHLHMESIILMLLLFLSNRPMGFGQDVTSRLEIFTISDGSRKIVHEEVGRIEAPNWSKDGHYLLFNGGGHLYRYDLLLRRKSHIPTDFADHCNNDHGISPDGTQLVISHNAAYEENGVTNRSSTIYLLPISGGIPKMVTPLHPSYWHGWSPDGKTLAYVGMRENGGTPDFDIYTISVRGGAEKRLTTSKGLDDGPDYSPDGKYIYFNSERTGKMQIWRMKANGHHQEHFIQRETNDWFPHPSPDGQYLLYLSYLDEVASSDHPADKQVALNLFNLITGENKQICTFTGGQGSINVPNWSPDSTQFAFMSYVLNE